MAVKMSHKKQKTITTVLQVFVFLVTIVMVSSIIPVVCFSNTNPYYEEIIGKNGELDVIVRTSAQKVFSQPNSIVNIPEGELKEAIDFETISENAKTYTKDVLDSIFYRHPIPERTYDHSKLEEKINSYFAAHPEIKASDAEKAKIKQHYADAVEGLSEYISRSLTKKLSSLVNIAKTVRLSKLVAMASAAAWIVLAVIIVLINRDNVARGFYRMSAATWIGSVTIAIPCMILAMSNISGRLALAESSLSRFACGFVNELESLVMTASIIHLVLFTVLHGIFIYAYASKQNKRHKKHSHHN